MKKNPLFVVFFTVFLDLLGFGILIPILPVLLTVKKFGPVINPNYLLPQDFDINNSYILFGFLLAVYALGQFIATPILGQLSDKYGRKPLLAFSLAGTCLSYLIFAYGIYTRNIPILFAARFFDGITGGNISVAQAVVADISKPENRAKNFGIIGAAFGLGFILGPYIGGKLSDPSIVSWFDSATPFLFAALLAFLNVIFVLSILPETNKYIDKLKPIDWSKSIHNIIAATKIEGVRVQLLTNFLFQGGFTFFTAFAGTYFYEKFAFTQSNTGDFYAFIGFCIAFTQAVITRKLSAKYPESSILKWSYFGSGIMIFGFLVAPHFTTNANWFLNSWVLFAVAPFFSVFQGLSQANSQALISKSVAPQKQGEILGINSSVQALAQSIPSLLSGFIAASFVSNNPNVNLPPSAYPLLISSLTIITAGLVFNVFYKNQSLTKKPN